MAASVQNRLNQGGTQEGSLLRSVDHVMSVVPSLQATTDLAERLGFRLTPKGIHTGRGTANTLAVFPGIYWEFLAIEKAMAGNRWAKSAEDRPGLFGLAIRSDDIAIDHDDLTQLGIRVTEPFVAERPVVVPEGTDIARFAVATIKPPHPCDAYLFLCQHFTPQFIWRDEWLSHPNGCTAIAGIDYISENITDDAPFFDHLTGGRVKNTGQFLEAVLASQTIRIFTPKQYQDRFSNISRFRTGYGGTIAGLRFQTCDMGALSFFADRADIPLVKRDDTLYLTHPVFGAGHLCFEPARS